MLRLLPLVLGLLVLNISMGFATPKSSDVSIGEIAGEIIGKVQYVWVAVHQGECLEMDERNVKVFSTWEDGKPDGIQIIRYRGNIRKYRIKICKGKEKIFVSDWEVKNLGLKFYKKGFDWVVESKTYNKMWIL